MAFATRTTHSKTANHRCDIYDEIHIYRLPAAHYHFYWHRTVHWIVWIIRFLFGLSMPINSRRFAINAIQTDGWTYKNIQRNKTDRNRFVRQNGIRVTSVFFFKRRSIVTQCEKWINSFGVRRCDWQCGLYGVSVARPTCVNAVWEFRLYDRDWMDSIALTSSYLVRLRPIWSVQGRVPEQTNSQLKFLPKISNLFSKIIFERCRASFELIAIRKDFFWDHGQCDESF